MPLIKYVDYNPNPKTFDLIMTCSSLLRQYADGGYLVTLRQLYYNLVSENIIPNTIRSYKNLGATLTAAREGGFIDWNHLMDRGRTPRAFEHWENGDDFLESVRERFSLDYWKDQPTRCFVFVEKEALEDVVGRTASRYDVPYFSNKGYLSASSIWDVAHNRMLNSATKCERWIVLHFGDHDPSGQDMSRDIRDRLKRYSCPYGEDTEPIQVEVRRIALNMDQIKKYKPPPQPAKTTDSRYKKYKAKYGDKSWELDALRPEVLDVLISKAIESTIEDKPLFEQRKRIELKIDKQLSKVTLTPKRKPKRDKNKTNKKDSSRHSSRSRIRRTRNTRNKTG